METSWRKGTTYGEGIFFETRSILDYLPTLEVKVDTFNNCIKVRRERAGVTAKGSGSEVELDRLYYYCKSKKEGFRVRFLRAFGKSVIFTL